MALSWFSAQRRAVFTRIGVVFAALSLAACQSIIPGGQRPQEEVPPTVEQPPERPIEQGIPEDRERQRVALLVPMTGNNASVGQSIANAANMAILDTGGERVRITTYDTAAQGGASGAANRALADGNRLFLGPLLGDNVRVVGPLARGAGVPVISFSNDTGVAGNGAYVMGFTPAQAIDRVVGYAYDNGARRFAALIPEGLYGQRAQAAFNEAVTSRGGRVVATGNYSRSGRSLQLAVTQLNGEDEFDALLVADSGATAAQAVEQLRSLGRENVQIMGTELWNNQPNLGANAAMRGAIFASVSDGMFQTLSRRYRERFSGSPYRLSSLGYDAALLVVRIAQSWEPGSAFPVSELLDEGGFTGVDGAFRFSQSGIAERALEVQRITASGPTIVSPAPSGF